MGATTQIDREYAAHLARFAPGVRLDPDVVDPGAAMADGRCVRTTASNGTIWEWRPELVPVAVLARLIDRHRRGYRCPPLIPPPDAAVVKARISEPLPVDWLQFTRPRDPFFWHGELTDHPRRWAFRLGHPAPRRYDHWMVSALMVIAAAYVLLLWIALGIAGLVAAVCVAIALRVGHSVLHDGRKVLQRWASADPLGLRPTDYNAMAAAFRQVAG